MTLRTTKGQKLSNKETNQLALVAALKRVEHQAIRTIASKITPDVRTLIRKYQLPQEDMQEIVQDSILVLINAIQNDKFDYQGYHPGVYAFGVAKRLVANKIRHKKAANLELKEGVLVSDFDTEKYLDDKDRQLIVEKLLLQLGETCRKVIQLKYFEYKKDKEIVEEKLLNFSSTNSLKSKRNQCMRKLSEIARKAGIKAPF